MNENNPGILVKDFIKKHLKIEEDLQNQINKLEKELDRIKNTSDDNDYVLFSKLLDAMIHSLEISYNSDGLYYISAGPFHVDNELLSMLVEEIAKRDINTFNGDSSGKIYTKLINTMATKSIYDSIDCGADTGIIYDSIDCKADTGITVHTGTGTYKI